MTKLKRNWDRDVVEKYIKPESQQKTPEVFQKTHVPIDKIQAEILRPHSGDDAFVTEKQFRDAVLDSELEDDNRIFIVKGEVGSGKSHLCQWLEYEINGYEDGGYDETHVAVHISRSNTRLDEILEILHEPISKDYEEVSDVSALDPIEVADFIIQGLRTFYKDKSSLRSFDLDAFLNEYDKKDDFRSTLIENIKEYQKSVNQEGKEQNIKEYLLSREDYGRICLSAFGKTKREDDVYPFIRRAVHDLLTRNIGIEDFKRELEEISEAYVEEGKRPVLICEDLTTFSVLKDDLLDHIFELSSGHFDVILGWTTGWERENIEDALSTSEDSLTYMKQRTQGYLSTTDDSGQAYFLEGRSAPVVLVRKYLEAIKEDSNVDVKIPEEEFDTIYPFNEAFIHHVYANLVEDGNLQQTPRILLVHVIADCLTSDVPPFQTVQPEYNSYVRSRPYLISMNEYSEACLELTQWYGMNHEGRIWLPQAIFDAFGVDTHEKSVEDGNVFFEMSFAPDTDVIKRSPGDESVSTPIEEGEDDPDEPDRAKESGEDTEQDDGSQDSEDDEDDNDTSSKQTGKIAIPGEDYREFQSWLRDGTEYDSVDHFRKGVVETLERWYEPTRLANENSTARTTGIYYARGSEPPVFVRGADTRSSMSFEVPHGAEHEDLYRQMLHYGYAESFEDTANFDRLRGWADDQVVDFRHRMRDDIENCLPEEMTVEQFIVLSHYLVMNIGKGTTEITRELVFESYELQKSSPLSHHSNVDLNLPSGFEGAFDRVANHTKDIRLLSQGFFLLKENVVDYDRLSEAVEGVSENLDQYISRMATVSVDSLDDAYRLGTSHTNAEKKLSTIIEDVSDLAGELEKVEQQVDLKGLNESLEEYRELHNIGHNPQKLGDFYTELEGCLGSLDVTQREKWREIGRLLDDENADLDLGGFRKTLNTIEDADVKSPISLIALLHTYQQSLDEHSAWDVYSALGEMIEELEEAKTRDVGSFRNQVRESSEFSGFSEKRDAVQQTLGGDV
ncbi:hypothetical protein [Halorussus halophilus]|uniref:hypothetical protein n=1 Tax=Halorussus halophilus TaxID=2650975 RepID=UPI001301624A|nr:hypothetical protein [Halorussus halophilus]